MIQLKLTFFHLQTRSHNISHISAAFCSSQQNRWPLKSLCVGLVVFTSAGRDCSSSDCGLDESNLQRNPESICSDLLCPHFVMLQPSSKMDYNWFFSPQNSPHITPYFVFDNFANLLKMEMDCCRHDCPGRFSSLSLSLENSGALVEQPSGSWSPLLTWSMFSVLFFLVFLLLLPPFFYFCAALRVWSIDQADTPVGVYKWLVLGYWSRLATSVLSRLSTLQRVKRAPVFPTVFPCVPDCFGCWLNKSLIVSPSRPITPFRWL